MKSHIIQETLEKNKVYLHEQYHVKNIGIFGSCIKGEDNNRSDIDLLVQFEKGHKGFFNYMRLKFYLEELFEKDVDLVMKGAVKPQLKEKIFKDVQYV